jgi:uncharacterized surface protein with fasciclin (FAS1) repeats
MSSLFNSKLIRWVSVLPVVVLGTPVLVASALAEPVLSGHTLSWPDDGWYQVQSADDYTSVCEGGTSCVVVPGNYIVINHTTGQRYEGIRVSATDDSGDEGPIVVTGNDIHFPVGNDWWQVLSAEDYSSQCEGSGDGGCTVDDGIYIVINLTTGERYENIRVSTHDDRENTIVEALRAEGFTVFSDALHEAEPSLTKFLDSDNGGLGWTLFAPTDEAFAAVDLAAMTSNEITNLLQYHLVADTWKGYQLAQTPHGPNPGYFDLQMYNGATTRIYRTSPMKINDSVVERFNIYADNGIVHSIGTVLTPPVN